MYQKMKKKERKKNTHQIHLIMTNNDPYLPVFEVHPFQTSAFYFQFAVFHWQAAAAPGCYNNCNEFITCGCVLIMITWIKMLLHLHISTTAGFCLTIKRSLEL